MRITADTNVLLRVVVPDDDEQQALAVKALEEAETVAVSVHSLCELAWVMQRSYGVARFEIAAAIRLLLGTRNVVTNRPMVEAGLSVLEAGGDFADGIIAFDGQWLGGETFVTFDRRAAKALQNLGRDALLLA